jgi:hypothetical protein
MTMRLRWQFGLCCLAAFRTDNAVALIFGDMRFDRWQFGHLMPARITLSGHPGRQTVIAMKHLEGNTFLNSSTRLNGASPRQCPSCPGCPPGLRRLFLRRLPRSRCSPAIPSEEGGLDDVVEFCCRSASLRSRSAICFSASAIFLSRSISSSRSLSISRIKRSFSRSRCSGLTGRCRGGWR